MIAKTTVIPLGSLIFGRAFISALSLLIYIIISKKILKLQTTKDLFFMVLAGFLIAINWMSIFHAIQISSIACAVIAASTYPVMTIFLEPLFYREKLRFSDIIIGIIVFAGILFMVPEFNFSNKISLGIAWGMVAAMSFTLRNLIIRKVAKKYPSSTLMLYQTIIAAITLSPLLFINTTEPRGSTLIYILILGLFFTAIPHTLFAKSLTNLKAKTVSIISSIHPVYSILLAMLFINEIPPFEAIIGGCIIIPTVCFEAIRSVKIRK